MDNAKTNDYDWYASRMEEEGFSRKKWSDEEDGLLLSALFGLRDGQLGPFAALLKSSAGGIHPHIAKQLVAID